MSEASDGERPRSVLVADDDEMLRSRLARALGRRGYEAVEAATLADARSLLEGRSFDLAVIDLRLGSDSGLDLVRELRRLSPVTAVLVLTGYGSIPSALEAVRLGAVHYLTKPATVDEILAGFAPRGESVESVERAMPVAAEEVPSLARVEWEHIQRVLADTDGNVSEAARRLGVHRRSLQRKLAKKPTSR